LQCAGVLDSRCCQGRTEAQQVKRQSTEMTTLVGTVSMKDSSSTDVCKSFPPKPQNARTHRRNAAKHVAATIVQSRTLQGCREGYTECEHKPAFQPIAEQPEWAFLASVDHLDALGGGPCIFPSLVITTTEFPRVGKEHLPNSMHSTHHCIPP
jgi:hypothetical protein